MQSNQIQDLCKSGQLHSGWPSFAEPILEVDLAFTLHFWMFTIIGVVQGGARANC